MSVRGDSSNDNFNDRANLWGSYRNMGWLDVTMILSLPQYDGLGGSSFVRERPTWVLSLRGCACV